MTKRVGVNSRMPGSHDISGIQVTCTCPNHLTEVTASGAAGPGRTAARMAQGTSGERIIPDDMTRAVLHTLLIDCTQHIGIYSIQVGTGGSCIEDRWNGASHIIESDRVVTANWSECTRAVVHIGCNVKVCCLRKDTAFSTWNTAVVIDRGGRIEIDCTAAHASIDRISACATIISSRHRIEIHRCRSHATHSQSYAAIVILSGLRQVVHGVAFGAAGHRIGTLLVANRGETVVVCGERRRAAADLQDAPIIISIGLGKVVECC